MAAGVTNMVLDALFIAVFKWGVAGAALATGLSQCVGGVLPLAYFLQPNTSLLRLSPPACVSALFWPPAATARRS